MAKLKVKRKEKPVYFEFPRYVEPKIGKKFSCIKALDLSGLCDLLDRKYDTYAIVRTSTGFAVHVVWYSEITAKYNRTLMTGHWTAISPELPTPEEAVRFAINADHL